jgi:hypothetical protein
MTTLFHDLDYSDALSISLKNENASSYGGILSNLNDEKSLNDLSTHEEKKSHKKKKNELQKITIEWDKEETEVVYVTGSFCNWKQFFIMPKINNIYSLTLPLPKALHKFKFRINDVFLINKKYPVMKEGENDCNFIDTSPKISTSPNHNNSDNSEKESKSKSSRSMDESDSSSKSNSFDFEDEDEQFYQKLKKRKEKMKKIKYSMTYPKKNNLNNYAPIIPYSYNYMYNIDINSSQKLIGKNKYYEPKENNILGDNCSYKKIEVLPAVEINHIHTNNAKMSNKSVLCSTLSRYRNKFITYLYYKPSF